MLLGCSTCLGEWPNRVLFAYYVGAHCWTHIHGVIAWGVKWGGFLGLDGYLDALR